MTNTELIVQQFELGQRSDLFKKSAIFLSAGVPDEREPRGPLDQYYIEHRHLNRISEAVDNLCRFAFSRNIDIVFGAQPAISPLLLSAARRFGEKTDNRVIIFQSAFFQHKIPRSTLELAKGYGTMLLTQAKPLDHPIQSESLTWMRTIMVKSPNLIGAIFIGGMDGIEEEAALFHNREHPKPMFAIGSTGSAAEDLLTGDRKFQAKRIPHERFCGENANHDTLAYGLSYPRVMKRIFTDLHVLGRADEPR